MSEDLENKKSKKIDAENSFPTKDKKTVSAEINSPGKEKENISSVYVEEIKEKTLFSPLRVSENKENINLSALKVSSEKIKVSFSPLNVKEAKEKTELASLKTVLNKEKVSFSPLKIEENKTKVLANAEITEKKNNTKLNQVVIEKNKKNIDISYSGISGKKLAPLASIEKTYQKDGIALNRTFEEERKADIEINDGFSLQPKEKAPIEQEIKLMSKEKGSDLLTSQPIYSKNDIPIDIQISENKEDAGIDFEADFNNKEDVTLNIEPDLDDKDGASINLEPSLKNKEDVTLNIEPDLDDKDGYKVIEDFILEKRKEFDIGPALTSEEKEEIKIINEKINKLLESEDPKRDEYAKEKVKGFFKGVSKFMNTVSFGMEGDLARVLMMPYELDSVISQGKGVGNTFKKGGVAGVIGGISGVGSMIGDAAQKLKYMSIGEIAALYTADFYTMQASKPSPTVKTPGSSSLSLLGSNDFHGQALLGDGDGTGEIGSSLLNNIFNKVSFFSNTANLKSFGMNMLKNAIFGSSLENQAGNVQFAKKKDQYKAEIDAQYYIDNGSKGSERVYNYGTTEKENEKYLSEIIPAGIVNPLKQENEVYVHVKEGNSAWVPEEAKLEYGTDTQYRLGQVLSNPDQLKKDSEVKIQNFGGTNETVPTFSFDKAYGNDNLKNQGKINQGIADSFKSVDIRNSYNLGYMLIQPINTEVKYPVYKIDFQFNPKIEEGSSKANYTPTTILNRIGDLQTYIGTSSARPTIELKYRVLSDNPRQGISWMSRWTLDYIQEIEMALRSLIVPSTINSNSRSTIPPIIRVNLGTSETNIFQFPKMGRTNSKRYRYFVAEDVNIEKNFDNSSYYISPNEKNVYSIRDTMGFDAKISLIEIKRTYFTRFPNLDDYYLSIASDSRSQSSSYFNAGETTI